MYCLGYLVTPAYSEASQRSDQSLILCKLNKHNAFAPLTAAGNLTRSRRNCYCHIHESRLHDDAYRMLLRAAPVVWMSVV